MRRVWPPAQPWWCSVSCLCESCVWNDQLIDILASLSRNRYSPGTAHAMFATPPVPGA